MRHKVWHRVASSAAFRGRVAFPLNTLCLLLICAFPSKAAAQAQYRFDYWTTNDGLPQNSVDAITQTPDGYLWFTTLDGLVRYDGVKFTVFDKHNTPALTTNRFYSLFVDSEGTLWTGTEDGGLIRRRDGVFTAFTTAAGLPSDFVHRIQEEGDGRLLVATESGIAELSNNQISLFPEQDRFQNLHLYLGPSGTRWTWSQKGLTSFFNGQQTIYPIAIPETDNPQSFLYEDRSGGLWGGPWQHGLFYLRDGRITHFAIGKQIPWANTFKGTGDISSIIEDRRGNVWFGTPNGLMCYSGGRFTLYTTADGLSSSDIRDVFEDREGTLWIGTNDRGINRLTPRFISTYTTQNGLPGDNIYPMVEDGSSVWIGTTNGLSRWDAGAFTNYQDTAGFFVQALAVDHTGRLWIGRLAGLGYIDHGTFKQMTQPALLGEVQVLFEDRDQNLWVGCSTGLVRYKDNSTTVYTTANGMPDNNVKAILQTRDDAIWVGTYGGLAQLKDGRLTSYTIRDGLTSDRVRSLYEDENGTLWIGTYDGGLSRFKSGRFTNYTIDNGLFNNGVFQILEDNRGNFWMSCNRGIYRVSKQQLNDFAEGKISAITSIAYNLQDGMLNTECNGGRQPAGIKTRDGKLWFPTQKGIVIVDPDAVPFNPEPPPTLIESVTIDGAASQFAKDVRLSPGQANLEIAYTGLSYTKPGQVRFKYQLVGQDAEWIDAGGRRAANYSYLRPGVYTFKVIAANSDGVWNKEGATLRVIVVPAFYQRWWFIALIAALVLALAFALYRYRVGQLARQHAAREAFSRQLVETHETFSRRLIESQEQERKRMASELHDSLGQNLLVIKNRALLGLTLGPDERVKKQFDEINSSVGAAMSEVRTISYNLRPLHLERLGLTATLQDMIEDVASASGIEFTTEIASIDRMFCSEAEINIYRILQECLNNIVKHSGATRASVAILLGPSQVSITVSDDGRGFQPGPKADEGKRGGLGLIGILERVRILSGAHTIESAPGKGTTVRIQLPVQLPTPVSQVSERPEASNGNHD